MRRHVNNSVGKGGLGLLSGCRCRATHNLPPRSRSRIQGTTMNNRHQSRNHSFAAVLVLMLACGTPAAGQQTPPATLAAQALETGKASFEKSWLEFGGSYFSSYAVEEGAFGPAANRKSTRFYVQAKNTKFNIEASRLTEADIENGQEWDGKLTALAVIVRTYEKEKGWGLWRDGPVTLYQVHYRRTRGEWAPVGQEYYYDETHELRRPAAAEIAALSAVVAK